jgi:hypothetical protein
MANGHKPMPGKGVLFQNKKNHEKSPDYKGTIMLSQDLKAGTEMRIAGWVKITQNGNLISLSEDNYVANNAPYPREVNKLNDDDVPF